jgi:hypothetical protein
MVIVLEPSEGAPRAAPARVERYDIEMSYGIELFRYKFRCRSSYTVTVRESTAMYVFKLYLHRGESVHLKVFFGVSCDVVGIRKRVVLWICMWSLLVKV